MAPGAEGRRRGPEVELNHPRRVAEGFYQRYLSGAHVLDIGYRGGNKDAVPVTDMAIGVELDYPGYDGLHLPFPDGSQDAVFASHTLEHIADWRTVLADWFRVLRIGGYLVIAVPHKYLYERKADLPSRFNGGHMRFYTAASLMAEIETALPVASWRLRSLRDIDDGFSYSTPPEQRAIGCHEIELVVEKIAAPSYAHRLVPSQQAGEIVRLGCRHSDRGAANTPGGRRFLRDAGATRRSSAAWTASTGSPATAGSGTRRPGGRDAAMDHDGAV